MSRGVQNLEGYVTGEADRATRRLLANRLILKDLAVKNGSFPT
jgi:hypothetical protein